MKKQMLAVLVLVIQGCGGQSQIEPDPGVCRQYTVLEFNHGEVPCKPLVTDSCAFGVHNDPVELSPTSPVSYVCSCNSAGKFSCFGSPGLPAADPLPGTQWSKCGVNQQCDAGLTCYGVCTFECGDKYNDAGDYGYDVASADRCSTIGAYCEQLPGVQINVCTK